MIFLVQIRKLQLAYSNLGLPVSQRDMDGSCFREAYDLEDVEYYLLSDNSEMRVIIGFAVYS